MYLENNTRPDIVFVVSLLEKISSSLTHRHWIGIKQIFRCLKGTIGLGLFYSNNLNSQLVGYANDGYLSDPHRGRSQTRYVLHLEVQLYHGIQQNKH